MQKLSETVYSSLFWLISGLLVWLVIVPVTLICLPVIILVKVAGSGFVQRPLNLLQAQRHRQTKLEAKSAKTTNQLVTTLLLKIIIELPALLAAVISLQPTKLIPGDQGINQALESQTPMARRDSVPGAIEVPETEKTSGI